MSWIFSEKLLLVLNEEVSACMEAAGQNRYMKREFIMDGYRIKVYTVGKIVRIDVSFSS